MVVLGIEFEDLGLLFVVECLDEIVDASTKVFSPFFAVDEPGMYKKECSQRI